MLFRRPTPTRRYTTNQKGIVLFIALIALVILTLSGIGLLRVVDTSMSLAGNLAYRQSAVMASDAGVNAAYSWLRNEAASNLWADQPANGYQSFSSGIEPDWHLPASWPANSTVTFSGPGGNTISYQVIRMCSQAGAVNSTGQVCNMDLLATGATGTNAGNSRGSKAWNYRSNTNLFYRIVVRVTGPRGTATYVQVMATRPA